MQPLFGVISFVLLIASVLIRTQMLKKDGIDAIEFGTKDKKDFIIPPFALFYLYLITANALSLPTIPRQKLFTSELMAWIGVIVCLVSIILFVWTLISFKKSFRVGLVDNTGQGLITTGAFAISRNPLYVCFAMMLVGQFLIFPSWILLIYIFLGMLTFHRQVLKEERFLKEQYGQQFADYCKKVPRYL